MCNSVVGIVLVAPRTNELDVDFFIVYIVANHLEWTIQKKWRDGVAYGYESGVCESDRHTNHQLFTRPDIYCPFWKVLPNVIKDAITQIRS